MELSDEDLRKELAKYMDPVPPVTGSTREVLKAKLAKFQSSQPKDLPSESAVANGENSDKHAPRRQTMGSTTTTTTVTPLVNHVPDSSPEQNSSEDHQVVEETSGSPPLCRSKSPNDSVLYEDDEYRVRFFPSADLPDYPGGLPVFRRRSLHPVGNQEVPSDPYEEFYIRSPRLQAKIDAERIISRVMTGTSSETRAQRSRYSTYYERPYRPTTRKSLSRLPLIKDFYGILSSGFFALFNLLLAPFMMTRVILSRTCSALGLKILLLLLVVCTLIALGMFFFLSDPFYRNPVSEFTDRISGPLASFLRVEN